MSLDAHARPPESMKKLFKKWQKASYPEIDASSEILSFSSRDKHESQAYQSLDVSREEQLKVFDEFMSKPILHDTSSVCYKPFAYEVKALPGLYIYPFLLPSAVQIALLDRLLHRDLSNPSHKSNLNLHYDLPYPEAKLNNEAEEFDASFFQADQGASLFPKDPTVHKPLTIKQMLDRKLRWVTLGGQYDWTAKAYPSEHPPRFPEDIACLLKGLFPDIDAQAAIINFYTPGDTLHVHRDVSEECDRGLVSISIGCDGLFIIGNHDGSQSATIRLRSGDVVLMSGPSRYAWHAMPKILSGSCPSWLQAWPADRPETVFDSWKGWIANKRINLNVRQIRN